MKKMKAILSVTLCLLMLWACFAPAAAAGAAKIPAPTPWYKEGLTEAKEQACSDAMTSLMYGLNGLSDYDKCLLLHDRLAAWVAYDETTNLDDDSDSYTAYGALVNRKAVCMGYARAYGWMLAELGIESSYERSPSLAHGWNKVTLSNGKVYHVDVTFDDPYPDVPGCVLHENLLVSSEAFREHHLNDNNEMATDYENLTDTDYDNSFDKNSATEIVKLYGNYYYMKKSAQENDEVQAAALVRVSGSTNLEETVLTVNTKTYTNLTHEGAAATGTKLYNPKMTAIGDMILYTDGKTVFAYNVRGNGAEPEIVYTLSNSESILDELTDEQKAEFLIQGLAQVNGELYITAFNDEQFDADTVATYTVKLPYCAHETEKKFDEFNATTCKETGYNKYICEDCRGIRKEETQAGPHDYQQTGREAATCYTYEKITKTCSLCGDVIYEYGTELIADAHPRNMVVTHGATASTCNTQGYAAGTFCNGCNKYLSGHESLPLDPNNHENTVVTKQAFPATCEKDGWTQEIKCLACNQIVSESVPVGKTGHSITTTVVPPTCTTPGYTLHKCSGCAYEERTDIVKATGHPADKCKEVPASAGSCVEDAYDAGIFCEACNTFVSGHNALGKNRNIHVGGWDVRSAAPTCTEDGYTDANVCKSCGYVDKSTGTVEKALGHTWNDGVVMKDPTCTDSGTLKFTCTTCNATSVQTLAKLGHIDENEDSFCDRCNKNLGENACPYCNQIHTGLFASLTNFFHKIFYLIFGPKKVK